MRAAIAAVTAFLALAACQPKVPDSGAGVGFTSYAEYQARREADLIASGEGRGEAVNFEAQAISDEAAAVVATTDPARGPVNTEAVTNAAGISAENDFDAVASERTIADDAARVAANREAYEVVEPRALPTRTTQNGALLVEFALSTTNNVGQPLYSRLIIGAEARAARGCSRYASPDLAQEAFLRRGGPQRDPMGLDPDGDGFACFWDPGPFRLAAQAR